MANDIYAALKENITFSEEILDVYEAKKWTAVETATNLGLAMTVPGGRSREIAQINAFYNRGTENFEPFENYYTSGLDFTGKTVGVVGHLAEVKKRHGREAKRIYVFEMQPKDAEDLPAEMEDELLPDCDIVIITGSSLANGTLPHLLELCRNSYTILTGPSTPQCRALFDFGIDRLAGLCVSDIPGMRSYIKNNVDAKPYIYGNPFLIIK